MKKLPMSSLQQDNNIRPLTRPFFKQIDEFAKIYLIFGRIRV